MSNTRRGNAKFPAVDFLGVELKIFKNRDGSFSVFRVWLLFATPVVMVSLALSHYLRQEWPLTFAFYFVPFVGFVLFFIYPAARAWLARKRK